MGCKYVTILCFILDYTFPYLLLIGSVLSIAILLAKKNITVSYPVNRLAGLYIYMAS